MRVYVRMALMSLRRQLEYRASFLLTCFGQFLTAFGVYFSVDFLFTRITAIGGFTRGQVLLCYAVVMAAFSIGELFGGGLASFSRLLGNGQFDRALVRPRAVLPQVILPNLDFTRLGLLAQAAVTVVIAIPASGVTWTWIRALTLGSMILCGSVVFFSLFLLSAACAFFTTRDLDFFNLFTYGARQFGRYPLSVYGKRLMGVLTFAVPLALIQYYPMLYLIGREQSVLFALLPLCALLFLLPCMGLFRLGLRRYASTGS